MEKTESIKTFNLTLPTFSGLWSKLSLIGEKIDILVPNKFKNLIESLFFYENGVIANRYNVDFIDDNSNLIFIGGCELEILNFKQ